MASLSTRCSASDDDLRLRFSFALQLVDAPSDSREEREFRQIMERDYLKAVDATLGAIRKMVADPQYAIGTVMRYWFSDLYADIDAMRLDAFAASLAPDVRVVVGNNPVMEGRQAAKEGIGYFFSTIKGLKHHLVNVVESNGLTFLEANVEYLRKDGKTVTIPVVTVLERSGELVNSLRIYFDVAPVYA